MFKQAQQPNGAMEMTTGEATTTTAKVSIPMRDGKSMTSSWLG